MSENLIKIKEALRRASFYMTGAGLVDSYLEAELLLAHLIKKDRLQLVLHGEKSLDRNAWSEYQSLYEKRAAGKPLAYLTGEKYFYGQPFKVTPKVLIPRPETELIIERAIHHFAGLECRAAKQISCLDLGTGSGVLAITLARQLAAAQVWAVDLSSAALQVAIENAERLKVRERIRFLAGSYYEPLDQLATGILFDLIVSNPPYIEHDILSALPDEVKCEPQLALDGGADGLEAYRSIFAGLSGYLKPGGVVLLEVGAGQQQVVTALAHDCKAFSMVNWYQDLAGIYRVFEGLA